MPPFSWSTLIGLVAERKIVPVVGQDLLQVATPLGEMPLYRFIALRVAEALEIDPPAPETANPLHAVATMYLEKGGGWQDIYSTVNEVMEGPVISIEPPAALLDLAAIEPFSLFVTTTFDPLLERALNRVRYGGKDDTRVIAFTPTQTKDLPDRTYDSSTACVFHLFGRSSTSPDYAVTEEDILEFMNLLQSDVKRPQNLFRELAQRDLLIIGNSFSDWVGRFFIRVTRQERVWITETRINSYVADDTVRKDRFFDRSKNVKVYDGTPAQFVAELRRRWSERVERDRKTSAQPTIERVPGSVFISYASEDRPLAKAVADALAAANIDVWFDRKDLEGGDDYARKIAGAIDRCAVFVPLLSKKIASARRFVFSEWRAAIDVSKKAGWTSRFLMPLVVDGEVAPDDENVPPEFREVHWQSIGAEGPPPAWIDAVRNEVRAFRKAERAGTA